MQQALMPGMVAPFTQAIAGSTSPSMSDVLRPMELYTPGHPRAFLARQLQPMAQQHYAVQGGFARMQATISVFDQWLSLV